jgi:hypothetical protein
MKTVPYTILIDTAETHPFTFENIRGKSRDQYEMLHIPTKWQCLGRHPNSIGDYSIEGMEDRIAVERKSMEDVQATVLGWDTPTETLEGLLGRRKRFEKELENLEKLECRLVVVEANLDDCLRHMPSWGKKSSKLNAETFNGTLVAYMSDRQVNWCFAGSRRLAEIFTFRFLDRFWRKHKSG